MSVWEWFFWCVISEQDMKLMYSLASAFNDGVSCKNDEQDWTCRKMNINADGSAERNEDFIESMIIFFKAKNTNYTIFNKSSSSTRICHIKCMSHFYLSQWYLWSICQYSWTMPFVDAHVIRNTQQKLLTWKGNISIKRK